MLFLIAIFFCKQKTAYEMRISDWSSDVCSSDLAGPEPDYVDPIDGRSLAPLLTGDEALVKPRPIISEYTDMGVIAPARMVRSEERRVGKEGVSKCRYRWSPDH